MKHIRGGSVPSPKVLLEHVEEENQGELANPDSPGRRQNELGSLGDKKLGFQPLKFMRYLFHRFAFRGSYLLLLLLLLLLLHTFNGLFQDNLGQPAPEM